MRSVLVKLYVDEKERQMIDELALKSGLSVNRYLRDILCEKALEDGYSLLDAQLFNRIYTKRNDGNYHEDY
jgi:hypothetical protein